MYDNAFFEKFQFNKFSQNGEDGVIDQMLKIMDVKKGWVCEFGAWDGKYLSNTFALVERGFRAVLIEGDSVRFTDLQHTCKSFPNIVPILGVVSHDQKSEFTLDKILARTDIPEDFTLLSIDIDTFDYHVWKSFENYRPRIVIIEINSGIDPSRTDYIHDGNIMNNGTSFDPTLKLAMEKKYELLCHTGNMIFVRKEDAHLFDIPKNPLTCFRTNWM